MIIRGSISLICLSGIILISNYFFRPYKIYYDYPWLDIPVHFLCGGFLFLFIYSIFCIIGQKKKAKKIAFIILLLITVGVELGEAFFHILGDGGGLLDSIKDVLVGVCGGIVFLLFT